MNVYAWLQELQVVLVSMHAALSHCQWLGLECLTYKNLAEISNENHCSLAATGVDVQMF
jgi:hypothetical protein